MLTIVVWKEWRQQGLLLLAILALAGIAISWAALMMPQEWANLHTQTGLTFTLVGLLVSLVVAQAIVTGAMLFAGEEEDGTLVFLDSHARLRAPLWRAKMLAGLSIVLPASLALGAMLAGLGSDASWLLSCLWIGFDTFAWSAACSANNRNTFRAIGVSAVVLLGVSGLPLLFLIAPTLVGFYYLFKVPALAVALVLSRHWFCLTDASREPRLSAPAWLGLPEWLLGPLRLMWSRSRALVLTAPLAAVVLGFALPLSSGRHTSLDHRTLLWPLSTFLLGCVFGWGVFAHEQGADRGRAPYGRLWLGRVLPWLSLCTAVCLWAWLQSERIDDFRYGDHRAPMMPGWWDSGSVDRLLGLAAFPLIGFGCAVVLTQHVRGRAAALLLTLVLGSALAALWYPSIYCGMPAWRAAVVWLGLLAASRAAMARWTSGWPHDRGGLIRLALVTFAVVAWTAGNLAWRAFEFADVGAPFDTAAYARELAAPENQDTERLWTEAAEKYTTNATEVSRSAPTDVSDGQGRWTGWWDFKQYVLAFGYPDRPGEAQEMLDSRFRGGWVEPFRQAVARSPVQVKSEEAHHHALWMVGDAGALFLLRAMAHLQWGDEAGALADLEIGLAAARHALYKAPVHYMDSGLGCHRAALTAVETMALRSGDDAAFRRRLADLLAGHEARLPGFADNIKSSYLLALESDTVWTQYRTVTDQLLRKAPWEQERRDRILRATMTRFLEQAGQQRFPANDVEEFTPFAGPPGRVHNINREPQNQRHWNRFWLDLAVEVHPVVSRVAYERLSYAENLDRLRGLRLSLAAALYRDDNSKTISSLEDLVPRYVAKVPDSPYEGKAFQYRVSQGEIIVRMTYFQDREVTVETVPGQGLIWDNTRPPTWMRGHYAVPKGQ